MHDQEGIGPYPKPGGLVDTKNAFNDLRMVQRRIFCSDMNVDWGAMVDATKTHGFSARIGCEGKAAPECRRQEAGKKTGQAALGQMQLVKEPLLSLALPDIHSVQVGPCRDAG